MITPSLISDGIWKSLPEEPDDAFLQIALSANDTLNEMRTEPDYRQGFTIDAWRRQYIFEVCTVAETLGIAGLPDAESAVAGTTAMVDFDDKLARVLTRIKASKMIRENSDPVLLSAIGKNEIRKHIEKLKSIIKNSTLSDLIKDSFYRKIKAIEDDLENANSSLKPYWISRLSP